MDNVFFFPRSKKLFETGMSPEQFQEMNSEERQEYVDENYDTSIELERVIDIVLSVRERTNEEKYEYVLEWRASAPIGERGTGKLRNRVEFCEFREEFVKNVAYNFVDHMKAEDELVFYAQRLDCQESGSLKSRKQALIKNLVDIFKITDSDNLGTEIYKEQALEAANQVSPNELQQKDLSLIIREIAKKMV